MALQFYTSAGKGLKLKVSKFWGLIPKFVEVTVEKFWIETMNKIYKCMNLISKNVCIDKLDDKVNKYYNTYNRAWMNIIDIKLNSYFTLMLKAMIQFSNLKNWTFLQNWLHCKLQMLKYYNAAICDWRP